MARITEIEVCAALVRRRKGKTLSADQAVKALRRLKRDFPIRFTHIAVSEDVVIEAQRLTETYGLRGYDAVQLSAVIEANNERVGRGLLPLILVSADTELNIAAQTEGLERLRTAYKGQNRLRKRVAQRLDGPRRIFGTSAQPPAHAGGSDFSTNHTLNP